MADRGEKIFPALPQKRQRAREQGQVARSCDLTAALSFAAAVLLVTGAATMLGHAALGGFRTALAATSSDDLGGAVRSAFRWPLDVTMAAASMICVAAVIGAALQGMIVFSPARLEPDLGRLNPFNYFARIFSVAGLIELVKAAVKVALVAIIAWRTARWALDLAISAHSVAAELGALALAVRRLLYLSAGVAIAAAAGDYLHKRHEYESDLRMTRQEFLDELKREQGNPEIKRALRRARRRNFKRLRGIHQAATATVVLTNPIHYAVALRYRRGFDQAPLVVSKGAGENAHRLIAIARMAAVPVRENKPLARALFKVVEVGEYIPPRFYRAIAEVLAALMRAEAKRRNPAERTA